MESNESKNNQGSGVNFGSQNIYLGTIQNVAGRDISHTTIQNFIGNYQIDAKALLQAEIEFAQSVKNLYIELEKYFVAPPIRIEVKKPSVGIPSGFKEGFSPELLSLLSNTPQVFTVDQIQQEVIEYKSLLEDKNKLLVAPLGYGKTTILKMLALLGAKKYLESSGHPSNNRKTFSAEEYSRLRIPIYVDLINYDSRISLIDFIKQYAWREANIELIGWKTSIVYSLFDLFLAKGKFLLLFDSFDSLNKNQIGNIQVELERLILNYPNNLLILAGRNDEIGFELGLVRAYIDEWDDNQVVKFFQLRLGVAEGTAAYNAIRNHYYYLLQWLSIPYIAFATALYYKEYGQLPADTAAIVEKLISVLVKRDLIKEKGGKKMLNSHEIFLSEVAFRSIDKGLGLQLSSEIVTLVADELGEDRAELINECLQIGFLGLSKENEIGFKNQLIGHYFVGKRLRDIFLKNRDEFNRITYQAIRAEDIERYKRSPLFRKPIVGEEIAWDRPLPKVEQSKWFEGLSMAITMLVENQRSELIDDLKISSCLTAGDLVDRFGSDVPPQLVNGITEKLVEISYDTEIALRARLKALSLLGVLGDPRIGNSKMCDISRGMAALGAQSSSNYVIVEPFSIDKFPVTNAQYKEFIIASGYQNDRWWTKAGWQWVKRNNRLEPTYWQDNRYNSMNQPVVGVSWYEAFAFSKWANKRLPTEAEWERTASWDSEMKKIKRFPTGNNFFDGIGNLLIEEFEYVFCTTPVGAYPLGVSSDGVYDLVGNVWEWLSSEFSEKPQILGSSTERSEGKNRRCLRGGSWGFEQIPSAVCTNRHSASPESCSATIGFRCAK